MFGCDGVAEGLSPKPVQDSNLHFRSLFRTNDKIRSHLFYTILKCLKDQQASPIKDC